VTVLTGSNLKPNEVKILMWILEKPTLESVAERWKKQYYDPQVDNWGHVTNPAGGVHKASEVYHAIIRNHMWGSTDLDNVENMIGNKSWTRNHCDSCGQEKREPMACFDVNGGEYEYTICWNCINKARQMIEVKR
jgi:hypothetical protein